MSRRRVGSMRARRLVSSWLGNRPCKWRSEALVDTQGESKTPATFNRARRELWSTARRSARTGLVRYRPYNPCVARTGLVQQRVAGELRPVTSSHERTRNTTRRRF